jgi:predicted dehydrogenase
VNRRPVRVVIVGAGLMGRWHAATAHRAGAVITHVIDPDARRAGGLARRFRADVSDLSAVQRGRVDVVHVCTPLATHATITRGVLRAGVAALVEKPLARSAAETDALLADAEASGVLLCPVHQFPFQDGAARVLGALERLGAVLHLDAEACSAGGLHRAPGELGDIVADILPHPLSLLAHVVPQPLHTLPWEVTRPGAGEFRATARAGATTIGLLISMGGRPTRNTFRIVGTRGTAHLDLFHGFATVEADGISRTHKIVHPFTHAGATLAAAAANLARRTVRWEPAYPGLRGLVRAMHRAVSTGGPAPITPAEIRDIALTRDRLLAVGPP